jgi:uncharacterized membrane protein HdeD (DUF308 family)
VTLGIVQLVIGVLLLFNPLPGLLAFVPALGILLVIGGLVTSGAALLQEAGDWRSSTMSSSRMG